MKWLSSLKIGAKIAIISIVFLLTIGYIDNNRAANAAEVTVDGVISMKELNDAPAAITGYGQIYVKKATGPYTSDSNTKLLLHADGADNSTNFTDSSASNHQVSVIGNTHISTASSKFGGASGYFDGTGDYLSIPDSEDWNFGSGDFTIDTWVRFNTVGGSQSILGQWWNPPKSFWILAYNGTTMYFCYSTDGTDQPCPSISWNYSANVWYHIAFVRNGNNLYFFADGAQVGATQNLTGVTIYNGTTALEIGSFYGGNMPLNGYIDELRILKGTARWTTNFDPPSRGGLFYKTGSGTVIPLAVE